MMRAKSPILSCIVLMTVVGWLLQGVAFAHRFGGPNDPCERKLGTSLIHITLYQPQFDPDAEYCDQVPRAGNTVLVVDVLGDELRQLPLGLQILTARKAEPQRTVLSIAPKIYRRGVADAQVMLGGGGAYVTQISLGEGTAQQIFSFPIRVAAWYRPLIMPALVVLAVIAFISVSMIRYYLTSAHDTPVLELLDGKSPRPLTLLPRPEPRALGSRLRSSVILVIFAGCLMSFAACHREMPHSAASLPDVQVIDDHGNPVSLGSFKGKVVLLDFIHVGCPGVCSNLVNKFGQVADSLGPDLGSKVILLSVTNDPNHDNAAELLKLARSSQADMKGWLFVTGKPEDVDRVIKAFGVNNDRLPDGSPNHITQVFLLGPDGRQKHEYQGMVMDSAAVVARIRDTLGRAGAS
jgi:cytochrome oxidase Cu insertion factor (SCO1/SenC/PrrC family)